MADVSRERAESKDMLLIKALLKSRLYFKPGADIVEMKPWKTSSNSTDILI